MDAALDRDWHPISTAPRDGTEVELLYLDGKKAFAVWLDDGSGREGTIDIDGVYWDEQKPSHWRLV